MVSCFCSVVVRRQKMRISINKTTKLQQDDKPKVTVELTRRQAVGEKKHQSSAETKRRAEKTRRSADEKNREV